MVRRGRQRLSAWLCKERFSTLTGVRPLRSLVSYLAVVFLGGALVAPWLYGAAQWGGEHVAALRGVAERPFHQYVSRALQGLAVLGLWPLLKGTGLRSWRGIGLGKPDWGELGGGFALGLLSMALVAAGVLLAGARVMSLDSARVGQVLLGAGSTAAAVAVLEEAVFRGALFGALRQVQPWRTALAVSSTVYALVHFFERTEYTAPVRWTSGLELLPQMLRGFGEVQTLIPGFLNLFLAGAILGLAYQRTENLYVSIGMHGGWIFWLKSYRAFTRPVAESNPWLWGTHKLIDAWIALPVLLVCLLVLSLAKWPGRQSTVPR